MSTGSSTSRRSGAETRDAIRAAAKALFDERGFADVSVREIARDAATDPALVIRYFGSKEALFLEVMTMAGALVRVTEGPIASLGPAIVRQIVHGPASTRRTYTALIRAADRPDVREHLAKATAVNLVDPIARRMSGPDAGLFAALIAAQVMGLVQALWIVEDPELTGRPVDEVIEVYGAALQALLDLDGFRPSHR